MVAPGVAAGIGFGLGGIAREPAAHIVVIALLAPQQASERLALHIARIFTEFRVDAPGVEFVRFFFAQIENLAKRRPKELCDRRLVLGEVLVGEAEP